MAKLVKYGKVNFNKSGSGSISGRVTIPKEILELLDIKAEERDIIITYEDGILTIKKDTSNLLII